MASGQVFLPNVLLQFHPRETSFPLHMGSHVPCSYFVGRATFHGQMYDYVEYKFEYYDNPAIGLGWQLFPTSKCLGYHLGDIERLGFLMQNNQIRFVCFKAHGRGQEMWLPWDQCEKTITGDLIAYVARGSHAFYPTGETYWRVWGLANDHCSPRGRTHYVTLNDQYHEGFPLKQQSISAFERFILPISLLWIGRRQNIFNHLDAVV